MNFTTQKYRVERGGNGSQNHRNARLSLSWFVYPLSQKPACVSKVIYDKKRLVSTMNLYTLSNIRLLISGDKDRSPYKNRFRVG